MCCHSCSLRCFCNSEQEHDRKAQQVELPELLLAGCLASEREQRQTSRAVRIHAWYAPVKGNAYKSNLTEKPLKPVTVNKFLVVWGLAVSFARSDCVFVAATVA
jgi:hypothetical protein